MLTTLLQAKSADTSYRQLIVWSLVIVAVLMLGLAILSRVRRRLREEDEPVRAGAGFSLSDLREMHKAGEMSDAEFDKAKSRVIDAAKRAAERNQPKPVADRPAPPVVGRFGDEDDEA